jgi:Family of unknown function (DUF6843)
MRERFPKLAIGFGLVVLIVGWGVHHVFSRPMRYEIPGGFKGWFVVQFEEPACPPLRSQGLFLVVSVLPSGNVCTSTSNPDGLVYYKFEYVFPDGKRERLRWNDHGRPGTQVWLIGYDLGSKTEENFVGDENAMNRSGSPPRPHQKLSSDASDQSPGR